MVPVRFRKSITIVFMAFITSQLTACLRKGKSSNASSDQHYADESLALSQQSGQRVKVLMADLVQAAGKGNLGADELYDILRNNGKALHTLVKHGNNVDGLLKATGFGEENIRAYMHTRIPDIPLRMRWKVRIAKLIVYLTELLKPVLSSLSSNLEDKVLRAVAKKHASIGKHIHGFLNEMDIDKFAGDDLIKGQLGLDQIKLPDDIKKMTTVMMDHYFKQLPMVDKAPMIADVLRLEVNPPPHKLVNAALQNAGPTLQKLFQFLGDEIKDLPSAANSESSKRILEVLDSLKNDIKASPLDVAQREIINTISESEYERLFGRSSDGKLQMPERLASASVGEVVTLKMQVDSGSFKAGDTVIVKIRRPGIVEKFEREKEMLLGMFDEKTDASILAKLRKILDSVAEELNFAKEAEGIREGQKAYRAELGDNRIAVVDLLQVKGHDAFENLLFMSRAQGKKVSAFTDPADIALRKTAIEHFYKNWLVEALFKDGFFHADLHAGNIYLDISPDKTSWVLTPIDYGARSRLDGKMQQAAAIFGLGLKYEDPEKLLQGLEEMTQRVEASKRGQVLKDISIIFAEVDGMESPAKKTKEITRKVANVIDKTGMDVPDAFIQFYRGSAFMELQIEEINKIIIANKALLPGIEPIDIGKLQNAVGSAGAWQLTGKKVTGLLNIGKNYLGTKTGAWRSYLSADEIAIIKKQQLDLRKANGVEVKKLRIR